MRYNLMVSVSQLLEGIGLPKVAKAFKDGTTVVDLSDVTLNDIYKDIGIETAVLQLAHKGMSELLYADMKSDAAAAFYKDSVRKILKEELKGIGNFLRVGDNNVGINIKSMDGNNDVYTIQINDIDALTDGSQVDPDVAIFSALSREISDNGFNTIYPLAAEIDKQKFREMIGTSILSSLAHTKPSMVDALTQSADDNDISVNELIDKTRKQVFSGTENASQFERLIKSVGNVSAALARSIQAIEE